MDDVAYEAVDRAEALRRIGGAVAPRVALMLLPLAGAAAFSVDFGHVSGGSGELQNGADTAGLAGLSHLCARGR